MKLLQPWCLVLATWCMLLEGGMCINLDLRFLDFSTDLPRGMWSLWSEWSVCTATCSTGSRVRLRHCEGGTNCVGKLYQTEACTLQRCLHKVDGGWGSWLAWGSCSVTCEDGIKMRSRACNNPAPQDGGSSCPGKFQEVTHCNTGECPIDGGWSNFTARPCSKTCGLGVAFYVRTCTNPVPEYGGLQCDGSSTKFAACNEAECVIDGGWSSWSTFTDCSVICGDGHRRRSRTCSAPPPQNGGRDCVGDPNEIGDCSNGVCPPDIRTCDQQKVSVVLSSNFVVPTSCQNGSDVTSQVDMITSLCNAPGNDTSWKLGISIADHCEAVPVRSPIGLVHRDTKEKKYGILLDCYREMLEFATQTCSQGITTQTINLTDTNIDYHLLLW